MITSKKMVSNKGMTLKMIGISMFIKFGSILRSIMFLYTMFKQFVPHTIRSKSEKFVHNKLIWYCNPNVQITFDEFVGERMERSKAYTAIRSYLSSEFPNQATRLKADVGRNSTNVVFSMDDHEEIPDEYKGVKVLWKAGKKPVQAGGDEKGYYKLTCYRWNREFVKNSYLKHVLAKGNAVAVQNRQRWLYSNNVGYNYAYKKTRWSCVAFDNPATFKMLAMETEKKNEIIEDLLTFSKSKDYYAKIGKAWKRGYLLYGPPGTGKSTMIPAMANLLNYDVYDLELAGVADNTELRKLLIETSSKSIIVIEDIDCSLEITEKRKKKTKKEDDSIGGRARDGSSLKQSKVTLSGLLNVIDGIWSACGGEQIVVFTTNHVEQLDPALIRTGRMDKHIEFSYCSFEGFKVLAQNYLDIDSHQLFEVIQQLLGQAEMTPADIAENLIQRSVTSNADTRLEQLVQVLRNTIEEKKLKAEQKILKAEVRAKEKQQQSSMAKVAKDKENEDNCKYLIHDEMKEEQPLAKNDDSNSVH